MPPTGRRYTNLPCSQYPFIAVRRHHRPVNTIRLPALPRQEPLEWGSTDWAAHSCLADWSQLERQWLGVEDRKSAQDSARRRLRKRFVAALLGAAALAVAFSASLRQGLAATFEVISPVIAWLVDLLPHVALGVGLLVLVSVALGFWREAEPHGAASPANSQPPSRSGAG